MSEEKNWYQSRTIFGAIITLMAVLSSAFGANIEQDLQDAVLDTVMQVIAVSGSLMAVIGRVNATAVIK